MSHARRSGAVLAGPFDLTSLARERESQDRSMRATLGVIDVAVIGFALWFIELGLTLGHSPDRTQWLVILVVEGCSIPLFVLLTYVVLNTGHRPVSMALEEAGLRLIWDAGREELLPWRSLARRFVLLDYSVNPALANLSPRSLWEVRRWNRPPSPLTQAAFDAIIANAPSHGLRVSSEILKNPSLGWAPCRAVHLSLAGGGHKAHA